MNGTKWVRMLRNVFVDGAPLQIGSVVELPERTAAALIEMGRAEATTAPAVTAQPDAATPEGDAADLQDAAAPDPETPERTARRRG